MDAMQQQPQQQAVVSGARQFVCVGCRGPILDQYVLRVAPDMEWHAACLQCAECGAHLDENCTCFVRDGKVFCKPDYIRLFGTKCAKCHQRFAKNDLVMRAKSNIYHVTCFQCAVCCRQLVSGDEFSLRDDAQLLCKADHEAAYNNNNNTTMGVGTGNGSLSDDMCVDDVIVSNNNDIDVKNGASDTSSSHSDGLASPDLLMPDDSDTAVAVPSAGPGGTSHRSRSNHNGPFRHHHMHHGGAGGGRSGSGRAHHRSHAGGSGDHHHHKTTRIRTVLNEKQLHMLRTCYSANSRPDALMKEQLVEMTGLSPRVIRVWFQNKRCKDKKRSLALKQLHQQQQNKTDGCHLDNSWIGHKGVPLIATSPVRHEPPVNILPTQVEVHKFPGGPWPIDLVVQGLPLPPTRSGSDLDGMTGADDSPVPSPSGGELVLPPGIVRTDLAAAGLLMQAAAAAAAAGQHHVMLGGDSFDDDTVVSFDDLSDVVMSAGPQQQRSGGTTPLLQQQQQQAARSYGGRLDDVIVTSSSCHGALDGHMMRRTPVSVFDGPY